MNHKSIIDNFECKPKSETNYSLGEYMELEIKPPISAEEMRGLTNSKQEEPEGDSEKAWEIIKEKIYYAANSGLFSVLIFDSSTKEDAGKTIAIHSINKKRLEDLGYKIMEAGFDDYQVVKVSVHWD